MRAAAMQQLQATEAQIQQSIIQYLTLKGWHVLRQNAGALLNPQGRPVRMGEPGTPDLLAIKDGQPPLFVEVKRPGKRPTPIQAAMAARLTAHGARCLVATSVEDVQDEGI